ncbi:hypothetical protein A4X13_0g7970 [Tilletia indica]|uniref:RNA-directed DNA polymerase n=1 Tax=Tilletia indica TaxID=43049 RepID=A0A177TBQ9_9BASI|nr:hypothetical protein A4X13_0g7970 [Tilletia indica]
MAYRRHAPLTTHIRVNDAKGAPLSSLLDTGASLSVIDRNLLEVLGGKVSGQPMPISGLGSATSHGWCSITFFLDARDERGCPVSVECAVDFHVLEAFAPGLCLGQDFINTHGVAIQSRRGTAVLETGGQALTFSIHNHMPSPFAEQAELCTTRSTVVPARSSAWVPVDTGSLAPRLDYTSHPRLAVNAAESVRIAGPMAVVNSDSTHILLTNFGDVDAQLDRRTPVADAVVAQLGDAVVASAHTFDLPPPRPAAHLHSAQGTAAAPHDTDAEPLEICERVEGPDIVSPEVEAATVMVDGVFKVGVDASGEPPKGLLEVLRRHSGAFALDGRPGRVIGHEMPIDLVDDRALHPEAPRRASPEKQRAMDATIDQLLAWDVIEPSTSPVSFPVLMIRQYEKWRFCVDYRQLNANTVSDSYPLPTTDSIFNSLAGKRVYSSLDAIRGYHQLPVRDSDRWKTAFTCHRGLYQYKTVPFGLRNAPAVFQRLMDSLLGELRWKVAVVYIDDVVVATHDMEEHIRALDTLLTRAEAVGLKFSPAKCTFGVSSLVLLGRKVSGAGVAVWNDRARAVLELRRPSTLRQLYHTMGLFGYYRSFIPNFATIAAPLTQLTRGWRYERNGDRTRLVSEDGTPANADRVAIPWGEPQQVAFDRLKSAIASPPVLAHPDPSRPYVLYVDASKDGFGAVLHQVFDDADVKTALAASLRAELCPSVPHHHQANPAERCIQTVKHVLQALCLDSRAHWDRRAIPAAELAVNATPSVVTGFCPFDLVYVSHPDIVHAVFDAEDHAGVGAFPERLAAADARLDDARSALLEARREQQRRYDASRAPVPSYVVGDEVYVRLPDRPVPGVATDKLAPRKLGPFRVRAVLGDHRVALDLPDHLRIGDTFSVSQLDAVPNTVDPFATHRAAPLPAPIPVVSRPPSPPPLAPRARRAPTALRDFETEPGVFAFSSAAYDLLRGPYHRPRRVVLDGRPVVLTEKPIAFLSRLTMPTEQRMVAPELELCCLAWAFGRFLHLLEGADVTVVTDHAPLGPMLTSSAGVKYGPVISKCRALMLPHLAHLRFVHRPGSSHVNADALSRLVSRPESDDLLAVGM